MKYRVVPLHTGSPVTLESPFPLPIGTRVAFLRRSLEKGIVLEEDGRESQGLIVGILPFQLPMTRIEFCKELSRKFGIELHDCISLHYPSELDSYEKLYLETGGMFGERLEILGSDIDRRISSILKSGKALLKAEILRPKVRSKGEELLGVAVKIGDILSMELSEKEMDLLEFLMMEGSASEFELSEKFGKDVVKKLISKGVISEITNVETVRLRDDQIEVLRKISGGITLLMGPTGSGKTEVYIEASRGKRVLVLVPEVSLIPQTYRRFRRRLGKIQIGVFHSYLSSARRVEEWLKAVEGEVDVLIGTRSAVFVPVEWDLMIADEEHDESYYQSKGIVYDAIEALKILSSIAKVPVILGSATPRIEDYLEAKKSRMIFSKLNTVFRPEVETVDLRMERISGGFAERVLNEIENTLRRGKAVMIFVRRKGFGRVMCKRCGFVAKCEDCDVPLTYHVSEGVMRCHICGREYDLISTCPVCGNILSVVGSGTERVEWFLKKRFPEARIERADRDVISRPDKLIKLLDELSRGKVDIIVGTRMIVKGIDVPRVELMVIKDVDSLLSVPDFTARIRVFQLLVQAIGRSGRGGNGKAVIQHWGMDEELLEKIREGDVEGFYERELLRREEYRYPPFSSVVHVLYSASRREMAEEIIERVANSLKNGEVLGPSPYPIPKIKGKFTYHFIVKTSDLSQTISEIREEISKLDPRNWKVLPNPRSLM